MNPNTPRRIPKKKFIIPYRMLITYVGIPIYIIMLYRGPFAPKPQEPFLIIVVVALTLYLIYAILSQSYKWNQAFHELAAKTGLSIQSNGKSQAIGEYRERMVKIDIPANHGWSDQKNTQILITLNQSVPGSFKISRRRTFLSNRKSNPPILDDAFSRNLAVTGDTDSYHRRILSAHGLRQGLAEIGIQAARMTIEKGDKYILFQEFGRVFDLEYLHAVLDLLLDLADAIERGAETP